MTNGPETFWPTANVSSSENRTGLRCGFAPRFSLPEKGKGSAFAVAHGRARLTTTATTGRAATDRACIRRVGTRRHG